MSQYGVNVPPGIPVFKLEEVAPAAKKMADAAGEVRLWAERGGRSACAVCVSVCDENGDENGDVEPGCAAGWPCKPGG